MGYVFSRVMRFYSMSYCELQDLPIYTFWELSKNIDRVYAEENKITYNMMVNVVASAFGGNPQKFVSALDSQIGRTIEQCDQSNFDKSGFQTLKTLMG